MLGTGSQSRRHAHVPAMGTPGLPDCAQNHQQMDDQLLELKRRTERNFKLYAPHRKSFIMYIPTHTFEATKKAIQSKLNPCDSAKSGLMVVKVSDYGIR